ncbi:DUF2892 domain-containing protein [Hyphomicrobium sp. NDB2Meth4]|uniref:YgaP family membrane protein n=1 Tax=Hyphomicrobium sp. NDB2Meth4 TaxID=1892846 RepID=UPI0009307979|nr:DUF2892 domain-containing protein [Hyphomicrobium sp. NDB2Meth4]
MLKNVGTWDRTARIILGLALLSLVIIGPRTWWGLVGLLPLITGLARLCPAYSIGGVNTCALGASGQREGKA